MTVPKTKKLITTAVIAEESEIDQEAHKSAETKISMVTALLNPRILEQRAAYSQLTSRRDRLSFLRHRLTVAGADAQIHGERMFVERQPQLRRLRLRAEPRPPGVMGVRSSDRRKDDVKVLIDTLPAGTALLEPPPDDDDDDDIGSSSLSGVTNPEEQDDEPRQPTRMFGDWRGLTPPTPPTTDTTSSSRSASASAPSRPLSRLEHKKKP